jgi:hypothetical protein
MIVMRSPRMVRSVPMTEVPLGADVALSNGEGAAERAGECEAVARGTGPGFGWD